MLRGSGIPLPAPDGKFRVLFAARLDRAAASNMKAKLNAILASGADLVVGDAVADAAAFPPGFLRATLALELRDPVVRAVLAMVARSRVYNVRKTQGLFINWYH